MTDNELNYFLSWLAYWGITPLQLFMNICLIAALIHAVVIGLELWEEVE